MVLERKLSVTSCIPERNLRPKLSTEFCQSENLFNRNSVLVSSPGSCANSASVAPPRMPSTENLYASFSPCSESQSGFIGLERAKSSKELLLTKSNSQHLLRSESNGSLVGSFPSPSRLHNTGRWLAESPKGNPTAEVPKNMNPLASLKRKRPPLLSITSDICTHALVETSAVPVPFNGHNVDLNELAWDALDEVSLEGDTYAVESRRGKHEQLEDTYKIVTNVNEDSKHAYFGLFDGHGGRGAAEFVAANLHNTIFDLRTGHVEYSNILRQAFSSTDTNFLSQMQEERSGAAALTLHLQNGNLTLAHCGDCRAVLGTSQGSPVQLSEDHRPGVEAERVRVEQAGGKVVCWGGNNRVQGVLAITRAFGDRDLKQYVTADPDVLTMSLTEEHEFVILATDGLWDCVNNQEAVEVVRQRQTASTSEGTGDHSSPMCDRDLMDSPDVVESPSSSNISMSPSSSEGSVGGGAHCNDENDETIMYEDYSDDIKFDKRTEENEMAGPGKGCTSWMDYACRDLVELSLSRGCRDDITVIVVDLRPYRRDSGSVASSFRTPTKTSPSSHCL